MGAIIGYRSRVIYTSNGEWEQAMDDALEVAEAQDLTREQEEYVRRFREEKECLYPGYCPHFEILFPTDEEKDFWSGIWLSAARKVVSGELNSKETPDAARRVFVNYWCASMTGFLRKGEEVDSRQIEHGVLNSQDAARADGELLLYELEWERRLEEINRRGILPAIIDEEGKGQCPFCGERFDVRNPYQWNGRRHVPCLTWLRTHSVKSTNEPVPVPQAVLPARKKTWFGRK